MIAQVIDEIDEVFKQLSEDERDWYYAQTMTACYLDDTIPCPYCDTELYIRSFEKVDSELMFGDESNATP